ncbi:MAG: hypothetical protein ACKV2U_19680 [Bryobacteraceae bacterium]
MSDKAAQGPASQRYLRKGHPSTEELTREQDVTPVSDARELLGDFWPEDESVDDFIAAVRAWRGHTTNDQAA